MKSVILIVMLSILSSAGFGVDPGKTITLPEPDLSSLESLDFAFKNRKSEREFSSEMLSSQTLSNLLWAANGVNRPAEKRRTAPSALNYQEVDIYVLMKDGAWLYEAFEHDLQPVSERDLRPLVALSQDFVLDAPVVLLYVADMAKYGDRAHAENSKTMAANDVGIVCQNVNLFCSAAKLATVPRATLDAGALGKELKLRPEQLPMLNNPVGYKK